jgi:hypothetical protein
VFFSAYRVRDGRIASQTIDRESAEAALRDA